jgi:hypothetical protein
MGDSPDFQTPDQRKQRAWVDPSDWVDTNEPKLSKEEQQELAHGRNRICKERSCAVCAPLREQRRLKKAQRKAEAQALLHEKGQPCGRTSCALEVCVAARDAAPADPAAAPLAPTPVEPSTADQHANEPQDDPEQVLRREAKRHRVGLPCGSEDCPKKECIDGFTIECTRRHRARRPCRSATCDIAICVAGRSTN